MPWKLLAFIAIMAVVLVFVGFNLDNRCDISLVFYSFRSVPVVITILAAYLLGLLSALFLAIGRRGVSRPASRTVGRSPAAAGDRAGLASQALDLEEPAPIPASPSRSKKRPKP